MRSPAMSWHLRLQVVSASLVAAQGLNCASFTCTSPLTLRVTPQNVQCVPTGCTQLQCCLSPAGGSPVAPGQGAPVAAPGVTSTCNGFVCPAGVVLKADPVSIVCMGNCDAAQCCETMGQPVAPTAPTAIVLGPPVPLGTCKGQETEWKQCSMPVCDVCIPAVCQWQPWSEWAPDGGCTGLCIRSREPGIADVASKCGVPCQGVKRETIAGCQSSDVKCHWSTPCIFGTWSEWDMTDCTTSSLAQKTKTRTITQVAKGNGTACTGAKRITRPCTTPPLRVDCQLNPWREWTSCSATCGGGHHTRTRRIKYQAQHGGSPCYGGLVNQDHCNTQPCFGGAAQECAFSDWATWTGCDAASPTQRKRYRTIASQASDPAQGACRGPVKQIEPCPHGNGMNCTISEWMPWHDCSKSCGGGQEFRCRHVLAGGTHGKACPSEPLVKTQACNTQECPSPYGGPICEFSPWDEWTDCSQLCGAGVNKRYRKVLGPLSEHHGCNGAIREIRPCVGHANNCDDVVDCLWNDWVQWGGCTRTCGGGQKRRWRNIDVMPRGGGLLCSPHHKTEVQPCNTLSCDPSCIDGIWSDWGAWSQCRANSCDSGYKQRHRVVATEPNNCGTPAAGEEEEFQKCYGAGLTLNGTLDLTSPTNCQKDCKFGIWQDWAECTTSCYGIRQRERQIAQYASGPGGKSCTGELRETVACHPGPGEAIPEECGGAWKRRDCMLSTWDPWSRCTESCDGGHQRRARIIVQEPGRTGATCNASLAEVQRCNWNKCPTSTCINCLWGQWEQWGACTRAGNTKFRRRNIQQMPNSCGAPCDKRSSTDVASCVSNPSARTFCIWQEWGAWTTCPTTGKGVNGEHCGPASQTRSRALMHTLTLAPGVDPNDASSYVSKGGNAAQCLGMQLDQQGCLPWKPCNQTCTKVPCLFNDWTEWGEGNCLGLCNRFRTVKQNSECGDTPCSGSLFETKKCDTNCDQPQDCLLGDWEMWGNCMGTHSQTFRARPILKMPHNGGSAAACNGTNISQTKPCLEKLDPMDCILTSWSMWSPCTRSCGTGWTLRKRHISRPAMAGGKPCGSGTGYTFKTASGVSQPGESIRELEPCQTQACPSDHTDCVWGAWTPFGECRTDGQRYRERSIQQNARSTGLPCSGVSAELKPCAAKHCELSDWTTWSMCDKSCDGGQRARHRQIQNLPRFGGDPCPLPLMTWEVEGCNKDGCHPSTDCRIGEWSMWAGCTVTCGYGQETRARSVLEIRQHLGQGCADHTEEVRKCMPQACPGTKHCHYAQWSTWSSCSRTCGSGEQTRGRGFLTLGGLIGGRGGSGCHAGEDMKQVQGCNTKACGEATNCVDAAWGAWTSWEPCQARCGGAVTWRSRKVGTPANHCGQDLSGSDKEFKQCGSAPCSGDVDCHFGEWGAWGACSAACDGVMRISRNIVVHAAGKGTPCTGPLKVAAPCNPMTGESPPKECHRGTPVDCVFSAWQQSACSKPCGGGLMHKSRHIEVPSRENGKACNGSVVEIAPCNTQACPGGNDCQWADWQTWGACDRCGGQRKRFRHIKYQAGPGGVNCQPGASEEVRGCSRNCHGRHFCAWAAWATWSTCSATCGNGRSSRQRQLVFSASQPVPAIPEKEYLESKFEALNLEIGARRQGHQQELAFAFAGGLVSFLTLLAAMRLLNRSRTSMQGAYSEVHSEALE